MKILRVDSERSHYCQKYAVRVVYNHSDSQSLPAYVTTPLDSYLAQHRCRRDLHHQLYLSTVLNSATSVSVCLVPVYSLFRTTLRRVTTHHVIA